MDKENQLLHEYESLRSEIRAADSLNYQIIGVVVGAVAVLLTTGFKESNPIIRVFIFLCTYVVTIPAYRLLQGNRRRTWRISTYIQIFIEPKLEAVKWETRLQLQGKQTDSDDLHKRFSSHAGRNEWLIISMFHFLTGLAVIFNGLLLIEVNLLFRLVGILIFAILNLWLISANSRQEINLRRGKEIETGYLDSWRTIRDAENAE